MSGKTGAKHYAKIHVETRERVGHFVAAVTCGGAVSEVAHPDRLVAIGLALEKAGRTLINEALRAALDVTPMK